MAVLPITASSSAVVRLVSETSSAAALQQFNEVRFEAAGLCPVSYRVAVGLWKPTLLIQVDRKI